MRRPGQSPKGGRETEEADGSAAANLKMTLDLLNHDKPPDDKYNVAYIIFFSMGAGFLFPWNSFITAADYFGALYPNAHIERTFSLAYMFPTLIAIILLIKYGRNYAPASRIILGFSVFLLILLVVPLLDVSFIRGGHGTAATLAVTVGLVVVVGTMDAIVQGSLFGIAGELPEVYTQALTAGTGASGLIVSLLRCFTKAALPNTRKGMRESALLYFIISAVFIAGVLAAYGLLKKLPIIRYFERLKRDRESEPEVVATEEEGATGQHSIPEPTARQDPKRYQRLGPSVDAQIEEPQAPQLFREPTLSAFLVPEILSPSPVVVELDQPKVPVTFKQVFRKIWVFALMLLVIYEVTLSIFPGFLAEDVHSHYLGDWYPVLLITAYNVFDLLGKMAPLVFVLRNDAAIVAGVLSRVLFVPAFLLCVYGPPGLRSEWVVFSLTGALGVTNGYFTSVLMMLAPKRVEAYEAETAGTIMVLFLVTGLAAGAVSGWLWLL